MSSPLIGGHGWRAADPVDDVANVRHNAVMVVLIALGTAYIFSQFFRSFLAIVASDLTRDLALGPADLGLLSSVWFAAFALAQPAVGVALDRYGPRWTVSVLFTAAVAGSLVLAMAETRWGALLAMALIGVGCAPVLMGTLYILGRAYPPERFVLLSSVILGVSNFGNLVSATPLALAAAAFGWRATFVAIGLLCAVVATGVAAFVRDPPRVSAPAGQGPQGFAGFAVVLRAPGLVLLLPLVATSYAVVIAERSLWIGPYFDLVHGLPAIDRANVAFAMAIAMTVASFAYAPAERWLGGAKRTVVLGTAVTATAFAVLALPVPLAGAIVAIVLIGGFGFTYSLLMAHGRRFFPDHLLGRGVTALNFLFIGGAALLQFASGLLVDALTRWGFGPLAVFGALHLVFAVLLAASLTIYLRAPARP